MNIKNRIIYGSLGIIALGIGMFLVTVFFESLDRYGIRGYLIFITFLIMVFLYWRYDNRKKKEFKIIDQVVKEVASEYENRLSGDDLEQTKKDLREYLIRKNSQGDILQLPSLSGKKAK